MAIQRLKSALFGVLLVGTIPALAINSADYIDKSIELIDESEYSLARTYLNPAIIDYRLSAAARSRAYYLRGYSYFAQKLYVSASKDYHRALEFNPANPGALTALGDLYFRGRGVNKDEALALELFKAAADAGNPTAMIQVGFSYLEGRGVEPDMETARTWLTNPLVEENPRAMEQLARSYRREYTDNPEPELARDLYEKAAAAGSVDALVSLAYMYQMGEFGDPDLAAAVELFSEAAAAGSIHASVSLGHFYLEGVGVEADVARARSLFEQAAEAGNPSAILALGHLYETGTGVSKDLAMATSFYEQAAAADLLPAQLRLAYLYLANDDVAGALNWLSRAAAQGPMEAHNDYAWVLATTTDDTLRDGELALVHAEKAVGMKSSASYLDTLAAAYAELGRFEDAVSTQQNAIATVDAEDEPLRAELERHLAAYEAGEAWRE